MNHGTTYKIGGKSDPGSRGELPYLKKKGERKKERKQVRADHSSDIYITVLIYIYHMSCLAEVLFLEVSASWAKQKGGHQGESTSGRPREPKALCLQERG